MTFLNTLKPPQNVLFFQIVLEVKKPQPSRKPDLPTCKPETSPSVWKAVPESTTKMQETQKVLEESQKVPQKSLEKSKKHPEELQRVTGKPKVPLEPKRVEEMPDQAPAVLQKPTVDQKKGSLVQQKLLNEQKKAQGELKMIAEVPQKLLEYSVELPEKPQALVEEPKKDQEMTIPVVPLETKKVTDTPERIQEGQEQVLCTPEKRLQGPEETQIQYKRVGKAPVEVEKIPDEPRLVYQPIEHAPLPVLQPETRQQKGSLSFYYIL